MIMKVLKDNAAEKGPEEDLDFEARLKTPQYSNIIEMIRLNHESIQEIDSVVTTEEKDIAMIMGMGWMGDLMQRIKCTKFIQSSIPFELIHSIFY
jgi:hypothetical protein